MAKITALFGVLALLAIVQVSGFRTTTITTVVEAEIKEEQKCKKEIQKMEKELMQCQLYLQQQGGGQQEEEEEHLRPCCNRFELFDAECRCEAIQHILGRVQGGKGSRWLRRLSNFLKGAIWRNLIKECPMIIKSPEMTYYLHDDLFFYS